MELQGDTCLESCSLKQLYTLGPIGFFPKRGKQCNNQLTELVKMKMTAFLADQRFLKEFTWPCRVNFSGLVDMGR